MPRDAHGIPQLMARPEELLAVVSDCVLDVPVPHFSLDDADRLAEFLHRWMQRQAKTSDMARGRASKID